jgi:hypothetical protein
LGLRKLLKKMKMRLSVIVYFILMMCGVGAHAQSDKEKIEAVINTLFTGMYKGDSSMVRAAFAKEVTMATAAFDKQGNPVFTREYSIADFLKSVATLRPEPVSEEIWNLVIQIDGNFAQAWCDYGLYVGKRFIHCGVDAFHLFKTAEGWKIFHLADTRRKENCVIPETIQRKHQ